MTMKHSDELIQTHPSLGIFRLAALSACSDGALDEETLENMFEQVESGALAGLSPLDAWGEMRPGLMAQKPSNMLSALYACGALQEVLPEVSALFGVPQIADDPPQVDIGLHLLRVLDQAASHNAPLSVRFSALVMNVGKSDSPPEHLPIHYRHVERGRPRIESICRRFALPEDCLDLALLALQECERVHRVSEVRAGPIADMLERLDAFDNRKRFDLLMMLCACDFLAYGKQANYPKSALLYDTLHACSGIDGKRMAQGFPQAEARDALRQARAAAIAKALRSERWS